MTERLHSSHKPIERLHGTAQGPEPDYKPRGFWYGMGEAWLEWCRSEMPSWIGEHRYAVTLAPDAHILRLNTPTKVQQLHVRYPAHVGPVRFPDWCAIAREYDGIEVDPYYHGLRFKMDSIWYYSWDCASGCIWEPRA